MIVNTLAVKQSLKMSLIAACALQLMGCGSSDNQGETSKGTSSATAENRVVVHQLSDPDMLNPITNSDAASTAILANIYQKLLNVNQKNLELVPVLAEAMPTMQENEDGQVEYTYQIRKEAVWDNGEPVTAMDVVYTHKVAKNPKVQNAHKKPYLEFIKDVRTYENDPKKVTFVCNKYVRALYGSGVEIYIIPEYLYDPNQVMRQFSFDDLNNRADELSENQDIIAYAQDINSEKWQREKGYIGGSGAYTFEGWETGARINLSLKKDWYGHAFKAENHYFEANMDKIVHQIVNDPASSLSSLKRGDLHVMTVSKPKDFVDLDKSSAFTENFNKHVNSSTIYSYLGINVKSPKLENKYTRQALAHLLDVNYIIDKLQYGYGERTIGPVMPIRDFYNHDITPYPFDPAKAKELLKQAGWEDVDGDGILDKEIDGDLVPFEIRFSYNSGNESRKQVGLILSSECEKLGIKLDVVPSEWSIYLENLKAHKFDIYYGAWVGEHAPQDPEQLWHTNSANGGSNYPAWGDDESDAMIDQIKETLDDEARKAIWMSFQEKIHDEVPYIFVAARKTLKVIHKKFDNASTSAMDPGYWEAGMVLKGNTEVQ